MKELHREQYPKAHKYLQRATELSPKDSDIWIQFGIVLMEMQEFEQAREALRTAYDLDIDKTETLFFLAEVHAHLGMFLEARNFAKKYVENDVQGRYVAEALEIIDFAEQEDWQLFDDEGEAQDSEYFYQQEKSTPFNGRREVPRSH
nr:tetratricopeptide repeat protein [Planococcus glaciei]